MGLLQTVRADDASPTDDLRGRIDRLRSRLNLNVSAQVGLAEQNYRKARADRAAVHEEFVASVRRDYEQGANKPTDETDRLTKAVEKADARVGSFRDALAACRDQFAPQWSDRIAGPVLEAEGLAREAVDTLEAALSILADVHLAADLNKLPSRAVAERAPGMLAHVRTIRSQLGR
ncbi:MAG: hypothetical protein KF723_22710 [Rhizobiaceae bacterium]|nr:hypothetical protein [Rhizobiaceae bacterium]